MSTYRVYMSARMAATGEQAADVTLCNLSSEFAEDFVETLNASSTDEAVLSIQRSLRALYDGRALLFVYMKEETK
jgi:hypothetical protein